MHVLCLLITNGYVICAEKLLQQSETNEQEQISKDFSEDSERLVLFWECVNAMGKKGDLQTDDCDCCNETLQTDAAKITVEKQEIITYTYNKYTGRPEGRSLARKLYENK